MYKEQVRKYFEIKSVDLKTLGSLNHRMYMSVQIYIYT